MSSGSGALHWETLEKQPVFSDAVGLSSEQQKRTKQTFSKWHYSSVKKKKKCRLCSETKLEFLKMTYLH